MPITNEEQFYAISRLFDRIQKLISNGEYDFANFMAKACCDDFMLLAGVNREKLDSPYGDPKEKEIVEDIKVQTNTPIINNKGYSNE